MEVKEPSAKYLTRPRYKQTEMGVIPEDWRVATLFDLAGKTKERFNDGDWIEAEFLTESGIRLVQTGNIGVGAFIEKDPKKYISPASFDLLRCKALNEGDLLICRLADPAGRACLFPKLEDKKAITAVDVTIFRPVDEFADRRYLVQLFSTRSWFAAVNERCGGSTRTRIARGALGKMPVPIPITRAEQEVIAEALSDADALIESLEQLLAKKRQLRRGAMQELLTGKRRLPGFSGKWETKQVGEFAECTSGGTPSTLMPTYWNGSIRWMSSGELNLKTVYEVEGRITEEGLRNSSAKMIPANCVLIGLAGQGKTRGTVAMNRVKLCTNQSIAAILPNAAFDSQYLYYNLDARYRELRELSTGGGGRGGLNLTIIKSLSVPFPERAEQIAIGSTFSDVDAEIAELDARLSKARQLKQGMMQDLLTGRIRLVQPEANTVHLPTKKKSAPAPAQSHNWQINEAVVISVLAKHFGSEGFPLGRKRCAKLSYLLHRHVEHWADGYLKKAAGPYNPAVKYKGPEGIAQKNGYIRPHQSGQYVGFVAAENIAQAEVYFVKWYGEESLTWLEQFRLRTNDELELLTTVDMAMVDLRKANKTEQLTNVKGVIRDHPEWEAKLDRAIFSDDNISRAIQSSRQLFGSEE